MDTEVKVKQEVDSSNLLFSIDETRANEVLRLIFPGMGKLKIRINDKAGDHYGAFMQFTDAQTVEICPNAFKDIVPELVVSDESSVSRKNSSVAKLFGQKMLDMVEEVFSSYPKGYRARDVAAKDKAYFMNLIQSGMDIVEARQKTIQKKASEVTTHEIEHIKQKNDGKFKQQTIDAIKKGSIGLGATTAAYLTLIVLSHFGQIPITPEQANDFIYHPAVLGSGWAAALIPAYFSMRNSTRRIEKGAYDKAFESGELLQSAITVNESALANIVSELPAQ